MNKTTISSILLGLLLVAAGSTEAFAWTKHFSGTRDQVRNACSGPGRVLEDWSDTTVCRNTNNGISVMCEDNGQCIGAGSGSQAPRVNVAQSGIVATVLAAVARVEIDPRIIYGDPHSGQSDALPATPHKTWGIGDFGQWHADPGTGGGVFVED